MSKTKRVITLALAFLFLATSVAFTVLVILNMNSDDDNSLTSEQLEEIRNTAAEDGANDTPQGENMLQGTQLGSFEPVENVSELQIIDIKEGNGAVVEEGATVTAHYTGAVAATGKIFQSSRDTGQPATFSLDAVIPGWTKGVPGMKVGGVRRLVIPAEQAYGAQSPSPDIPANADLVFDIELTATE